MDQSEKKTPAKLSISEEAARLAIRELRALVLTKSQIDLKFPAGETEFLERKPMDLHRVNTRRIWKARVDRDPKRTHDLIREPDITRMI